MENILQVEGVTKIFKNKRGVKDITFNIHKGEVYGLLGPNGAGKTTLMKIITGLIKARRGRVMISGQDIEDHHEKSLSQIGCLIETPSFIGYISVEKNIKMASKSYKVQNSIDEILDLVGLLRYKKEKPEKFSLGMKQRLGIALCLLGDPKLIILDEPANGLDIEGIVEVREIILRLREKKDTSFLISSHLSSEIQKICTRVGIMYEGELISQCEMETMHENFPDLEEYFLSIIKSLTCRSNKLM